MKRFIIPALIALAPLSAFAAAYSFSTTVYDAGTHTGDTMDGLAHGQASTWGLYGTAYGSNYTNLVNEVKSTGSVITGATLTLTGIKDWTAEPHDVLYVNILKGLNNGISKYTYDSTPDNYDAQNEAYGANAFQTGQAAGGLTYTAPGANYANSLLRAPNSSMPINNLTGVDAFNQNDLNTMPGTWSDTVGPYGSGAAGSTVVITLSAANLALLEQYLEADSTPGTSPTVGLGFAAECHYYINDIKLDINVGTVTVPDTASTLALMGLGFASLVAFRRRQSK